MLERDAPCCPDSARSDRTLKDNGHLCLANCYFAHNPLDSPPCYHSSMRHFLVLFIHLIAILTQLFQPGGVRSLIAESLLLKHQLLILNRSHPCSQAGA